MSELRTAGSSTEGGETEPIEDEPMGNFGNAGGHTCWSWGERFDRQCLSNLAERMKEGPEPL